MQTSNILSLEIFSMRLSYISTIIAGFLLAGSVAHVTAQDSEDLDPNQRRAEFAKVGAAAGTFLTLPVGARAMALGSGFVAVAEGPAALAWNPSGIMQTEGVSASYSYTSMFAGLGVNYAGLTVPISDAYTVGISALTFGSGDIRVTTLFDQEGRGETYSVNDLAFGLTIAGQLTEQFSFGATGKLVSLGIGNLNASAVAFDAGTLYRPGILGLRIGFAVQNLSAPVKYTGDALVRSGTLDPNTGNQNPDQQLEANEATLPLTFRAGLASDIFEGDEMNALLVGAEFSTSSATDEHLGIGAEYVWNKLVAVRAGFQLGSPDAYGITGGIGVNYESGSFGGTFDYGIKPHADLGLIHQITASLRLQ
jgi:hypothetical protein